MGAVYPIYGRGEYSMEQFAVLTTVTDFGLMDRISNSLEQAEIPVLLEHVEIIDGEDKARGIRIMVPTTLTVKAKECLKLEVLRTRNRESSAHATFTAGQPTR